MELFDGKEKTMDNRAADSLHPADRGINGAGCLVFQPVGRELQRAQPEDCGDGRRMVRGEPRAGSDGVLESGDPESRPLYPLLLDGGRGGRCAADNADEEEVAVSAGGRGLRSVRGE